MLCTPLPLFFSGLAVSPRHPDMFSAGDDKLVKCWDLESRQGQPRGYPTPSTATHAGTANLECRHCQPRMQALRLTAGTATHARARCRESHLSPLLVTVSLYAISGGSQPLPPCVPGLLGAPQVIRSYHGHLSGVYCLTLHPTLDLLMTGGRDSVCRVSTRALPAVHSAGIKYIAGWTLELLAVGLERERAPLREQCGTVPWRCASSLWFPPGGSERSIRWVRWGAIAEATPLQDGGPVQGIT